MTTNSPSTNATTSTPTLSTEEQARLKRLYAERVAGQDAKYPGYQEAWETLTAKILVSGGVAVVPPLERSGRLGSLLVRGAEFRGVAVLNEGEACQCHYNTAVAWLEDKAVKIITGFGLSPDGLWREHSWGVGRGGSIIESTEIRDVYWGVELDDEEAFGFSMASAPNEFDELLSRVHAKRVANPLST